MPKLEFSIEATAELTRLVNDNGLAVQFKAVRSALGKLQLNPRHPGLHTHKYKGEKCPHGDDVFQAYAQNRTPGAFRIWFCYKPPPAKDTLLIISIMAHP